MFGKTFFLHDALDRGYSQNSCSTSFFTLRFNNTVHDQLLRLSGVYGSIWADLGSTLQHGIHLALARSQNAAGVGPKGSACHSVRHRIAS